MHSNPNDGYQVLHIAKSNKHVVLDFTHTRSHLTVRASEVVNALRTQRMGRAIFVKQRDGTWTADVVGGKFAISPHGRGHIDVRLCPTTCKWLSSAER